MQSPPPPDLEAIREVVQEFYGPCKENPYPMGYRIPEFSLFSREDGQSTLVHVARFIVQYGELANYKNSP